MGTIHVRNVPEDVVEALKQRASESGRSLNNEVVEVLTRAVRRRSVEEVLASIRENAATLGPWAAEVDVVELIREGREERTRRILGESD